MWRISPPNYVILVFASNSSTVDVLAVTTRFAQIRRAMIESKPSTIRRQVYTNPPHANQKIQKKISKTKQTTPQSPQWFSVNADRITATSSAALNPRNLTCSHIYFLAPRALRDALSSLALFTHRTFNMFGHVMSHVCLSVYMRVEGARADDGALTTTGTP